ncbi:MATE family efflux transporter [Desulfosporosinus sp. OT]|uniref:MATE family efflux transporter n=1 Tax=Desulfosporosinus sp. OT TaxID=913865 RepID=UPI0002DCFF65|nr:MATE family efflux transporter [Desulfosporosinus sp. OT]
MSSDLIINQDLSVKRKIRVILTLAIPAMIENILQAIVGFVDILFVSKLGLIEVTAVGVANAILAVYIAIFMALGIGTSALIARAVGAGEFDKARDVARQSTMFSVYIGLIFGMVALIFAEPLLRLMGAEPRVLVDGVKYFRIVAIPSVFISLMLMFGNILRAYGDTKTPMKVSLWINILHVGLVYILIFGLWKFDGFGIEGAALATVIARITGTLALYYFIAQSRIAFSFLRSLRLERNSYTLPILKLSAPAAAERLIMRLGQVLYFGLIIRIGTETYAAHIIAGNIEVFSFMPGYGLAIAATILVGQNLGANRVKEARSYGLWTSAIAVIVMSFFGVILFFFSPWFATWFTQEENVIDMVATALRIDAFAQPALALSLVLAGALQGAGDTKSPMYSTAIGMFFIRVLGVYIFGLRLGMGIAGVWISIAIDLFIRAVYLLFRFINRSGSLLD